MHKGLSCYKLARFIAQSKADDSLAHGASGRMAANYIVSTLDMREIAHLLVDYCLPGVQAEILKALDARYQEGPTKEEVKLFRKICGNLFSLSSTQSFYKTDRWSPGWADLIVQLGARISEVSYTTHPLNVYTAYANLSLLPNTLPIRIRDGIRTLFCVMARHRLVGVNRDVRNHIAKACVLADWLYLRECDHETGETKGKRARLQLALDRSSRTLMFGTRRIEEDANPPLRVRVIEAWRNRKYLEVAQLLCGRTEEEMAIYRNLENSWMVVFADEAVKHGNVHPLRLLHQWCPGELHGPSALVVIVDNLGWGNPIPAAVPITAILPEHIPLALCVLDIMKDNDQPLTCGIRPMIIIIPRLVHRATQLGLLFYPERWKTWSLANHADRMFYTLEFRNKANLFLRGSFSRRIGPVVRGCIVKWLAILYHFQDNFGEFAECRTIASCKTYIRYWGLHAKGVTRLHDLQRIVRAHCYSVLLYKYD